MTDHGGSFRPPRGGPVEANNLSGILTHRPTSHSAPPGAAPLKQYGNSTFNMRPNRSFRPPRGGPVEAQAMKICMSLTASHSAPPGAAPLKRGAAFYAFFVPRSHSAPPGAAPLKQVLRELFGTRQESHSAPPGAAPLKHPRRHHGLGLLNHVIPPPPGRPR